MTQADVASGGLPVVSDVLANSRAEAVAALPPNMVGCNDVTQVLTVKSFTAMGPDAMPAPSEVQLCPSFLEFSYELWQRCNRASGRCEWSGEELESVRQNCTGVYYVNVDIDCTGSKLAADTDFTQFEQ